MTEEPQAEGGRKTVRTRTLTASISAATHCRLDAFMRQQTELWNAGLQERMGCYEKTGKRLSYYDQCKSLTEIRGEDEDFRRFPVTSQRSVLRRLDKAFKSFFRHVKKGQKPGFPRFKGERGRIRSFDIPDPVIRDGSLWLKGIGRFRLPSVPDGKLLQARVVKSALRVVVQFAVEVEIPKGKPTAPIGIDMGVKNRAILSNGETIPAVHIDRKPLERRREPSRAPRRVHAPGTRRWTLCGGNGSVQGYVSATRSTRFRHQS